MKRIIAICISVLILVSSISFSALAAEESGLIAAESLIEGVLKVVSEVDTDSDELASSEITEDTLVETPLDDKEAIENVSLDESDEQEMLELDEEIVAPENAISAITYKELIEATEDNAEIWIEENVLIDEDSLLGEGHTLHISDGVVTLAEGILFENEGRILVSGGELIICAEAELVNQRGIEISGDGRLVVEEYGVYSPVEDAILCLDITADNSKAEIHGIELGCIERRIFAPDADCLAAALAGGEYAFTTICIDDPMMIVDLGVFTIGEGVSISLR